MEHASLWLEVPEVAEVLPDAWRDESLFAARLRAIDVASYARTRNHLDGAVTGLSPWIGHGFSPVAQVVAWLARYRGLRARHKLAYEFAWREYFHHVWARLGAGILADIRPGLAGVQGDRRERPVDLRDQGRDVDAIERRAGVGGEDCRLDRRPGQRRVSDQEEVALPVLEVR